MELYHFIYLLAAAVGIVSAGIAGSAWAMATGAAPRIGILHRLDAATPLKVLALVVYAPLGVVRLGIDHLAYNPLFSLVVMCVGLGWSFLQGVFILTTFFGFT